MIDPTGETWREITAWAEAKIEDCRTQLEAPGLPPEDTERLRGAIRALRDLVNLPNRSKIPPTLHVEP